MYAPFPSPSLSLYLSFSLSLSLSLSLPQSVYKQHIQFPNIQHRDASPRENDPGACRCRRNTSGRARSRVTRSGDTNITSRVYLSIGLPIGEPDQSYPISLPSSLSLSLSLFLSTGTRWCLPPCIIKYLQFTLTRTPPPRAYLSRESCLMFTEAAGTRADKYHACRQFFPPYFPSLLLFVSRSVQGRCKIRLSGRDEFMVSAVRGPMR